jgi:divalent metal cation (Fe/Co/Zn/Cd) transporter
VAIKLAKPCIDELLEKSLPKETEQKIMDIIQSIPEVKNPHNLRTRHIGNNIAIECHVRMDGNMSLRAAHDITRTIESKLKNEFGNDTHIGIHAEPEN